MLSGTLHQQTQQRLPAQDNGAWQNVLIDHHQRTSMHQACEGASWRAGDGKCVVCDSYVRPATLVRICDECNYGSYAGRCVICGGVGISDAYYCKECTVQEKDVRPPVSRLLHALPLHMLRPLGSVKLRHATPRRQGCFSATCAPCLPDTSY